MFQIGMIQNQEMTVHTFIVNLNNPFKVKDISPTYNEQSEEVDDRVILRDNFEHVLANKPEVLIFGEDSGQIGGVNQGLEGLQKNLTN